jgi:hypothetical protein
MRIKFTLTLFSLIILTGCAVITTKGEAFPEMYIEKPVSILVLPPINESTRPPAVPVKTIIPRSDAGKPNCTPVIPITVAPKTDPNVPSNDMPPDVPFITDFNLVI